MHTLTGDRGKKVLRGFFEEPLQRPPARNIGIEVERGALWGDKTPFAYTSKPDKPGAETLLAQLAEKHEWTKIDNGSGRALGLNSPSGKVSLEPGSQLEFSSNVFPDLNQALGAVDEFEKKVSDITNPWGLHWLPIGVNPYHKVEEIELIPSPRYRIMTDYLGKKARLGTSMMRLTTSVQINLDYTTEPEAIDMLRASLAAAPVSYALFANSPYVDGKPSGYLSFRGAIWHETDPDRTGLLPEVFKEGFDFEAYTNLLWNRPLMFVQSNSGYVPAKGLSLEQISKCKLSCVGVTLENLMNAVREMFPESRLKPGYVEVRSVDGQPAHMRSASAAFWMGLLYSEEARRWVGEHFTKLSAEARDRAWKDSIRHGLRTKVGNHDLLTLTKELVPLCEKSLRARNLGEEKFLQPVMEMLASGKNQADRLLSEASTYRMTSSV